MSSSISRAASAGLLLALAATGANAVQRTFVSSYGLDTNLCSIQSPCRSLAAAIALTDANGEVLVLDAAGYGSVTISRSVSIIAPDGIYAGISVFAGQSGIVVNAPGGKVTLRGLTLNGQGGDDGILIQSAGDVFLERVTIANTGNNNTDAGIRVAAPGSRVYLSDSTVRGGTGYGLRMEANASVVVDRSRIEGNGNAGIAGQAPGGRLTVSDSLVTRNTGAGVDVSASAAGTWDVTIARIMVEGNAGDGVLLRGGTGGNHRLGVTNSVLRGNGAAGVKVSAAAGETATVLVGDSRVMGNTGAGVDCSVQGTVSLTAERNEVMANGTGFLRTATGACTFRSMGNNTVENNSADVTGTITPGTLR